MYHLTAIVAMLSLAAAAPFESNNNDKANVEQPKVEPRCDYLLENNPWRISNLTAFSAARHPAGSSYVSFHFCDTNPGLELDTMCTRRLPKGSTDSCEDPNNYYVCDNDDVQFMYDGESLTLERVIIDPCLGDWPYNSAIAYGKASTHMVRKTLKTGKIASQRNLEVHITAEA